MQIKKGTNADGKMAVEITLPKSDPRTMLILALAKHGASAIKDTMTGFTYKKDGDQAAASELEATLLKMLPRELAEEILEASRKGGAPDVPTQDEMMDMLGSFQGGGMPALMPFINNLMKGGNR